ncbi:hypothetical protein ElyMa_006722700 [Elysia marginata]|uniref:RRM domain-containing protein n=1 Tax=Elysia marginata TaxID=1093978 RepID=A0AAV4IW37_9GAST|nr:hypothetical protein ElyMa_006722700 [Elysia marginata]
MATTSRVPASFILDSAIIPKASMNVGLEICKACEAVAGVGSCDGAQKISGLWRIYPTSVEARRDLIVSGVELGGQAITVLGQNPFLVRGLGEIPTTKLLIGNIPISVAESEIIETFSTRTVSHYAYVKIGKAD